MLNTSVVLGQDRGLFSEIHDNLFITLDTQTSDQQGQKSLFLVFQRKLTCYDDRTHDLYILSKHV